MLKIQTLKVFQKSVIASFQTNQDIAINDDTMLLFNTTERLLIDIDT
ncbi:DUF276 domain-containing protein [Borreliella afzelii]